MIYTEFITSKFSGLGARTYYFTLISLSKVTLVSIFAVYISLMKVIGITLSRKILKAYQVLYTIALVSQFIVFTVYWTALHHTTGELQKRLGPGSLEYLIISHLVPFLCISSELILSKPVILQSELKYMILYGLGYSVYNYFQVTYFDKEAYPFMTWKDSSSFISIIVIQIVMTIFYLISSKVTSMINGEKEKED